MNRRDDSDYDENGTLKDGRSVRVGIMMTDHGPTNIADAYTRSVADLNGWRNEGKQPRSSAPAPDFGTFAPLRDHQRVSDEQLDRIEAHADAARERANAELNQWRNA